MTLSPKGLAAMDLVYGPGFSTNMHGQSGPFVEETVNQLFADIWSRPGLSVRDRRLLVLGATAALGRSDLIQVQVRGALANAELDADELNEIVTFLAYYVGWGNATEVQRGVAAAIADASPEPSTTASSSEGDSK